MRSNTSAHVISDDKFSVSIDGNECPTMRIDVGQFQLDIYFHGESVDRALLDIDTAIRAFLDNRK